MEQLSFRLEVFEGPLELLLHLISKHKLNINDIPISILVDQYLEYIDTMAVNNMEITGEFLEMAARLVYIKTISLLPRHEEAEELKKELEGRLIEYSLCRAAAALLREKYSGNSVFVRSPMKVELDMTYKLTHDPGELVKAYLGMDHRRVKDEPVTSSVFSQIVAKKYVPVKSRMVYILRMLYENGSCCLTDIFNDMKDRSERVAAFLAVLELTKSGRITLNDDNTEISFSTGYKPDGEDDLGSDFDEFDEEDKKEKASDDI